MAAPNQHPNPPTLQPTLAPLTGKIPNIHPARPTSSHPFHILCFGNSLTAGYSRFGTEFHHYATTLKSTLETSQPHLAITTTIDGFPGDLVCPGGIFKSRLQEHCLPTATQKYDLIIILGGTNDLAYSFTPEAIFAALVENYTLALGTGARVLALTIPERAAEKAGSVLGRKGMEKRVKLNDMLMGYEAERWVIMDLAKAVPYHELSEERKDEIWDDGLHLTKEGYELMGRRIGEFLVGSEVGRGILGVDAGRS